MSDSYSVLVVDDEPAIARLLKRELENEARSVRTAHSAEEALQEAGRADFNVAVVDIRLPDARGIDLMRELRSVQPDLEVICITGHGTIGDAVEAMRLGAYDYITKPFNLEEMELVVERAYQKASLRSENRRLRHAHAVIDDLIVGTARPMQEVRYLLERVAPTDVPVLLTGESGVGKEVLAHAVQRRSLRSEAHFVIKNCATLQKELARSELFGHVRGAFTGALHSSSGLFGEAHKGTLFLDEIGDIAPEVQASLLRVLENGTYRPVGDKAQKKCDIRFIFATNRNLAAEVDAGRFNEAFFHRINVFTIHLPPLRERREDIPLLVEHFLRILPVGHGQTLEVDAEAMDCLRRYSWPGNVRELRNVIERGIILAEHGAITLRSLPHELSARPEVPSPAEADAGTESSPTESLKSLERGQIEHMLELCGGNRTQTARKLGISRKTLYRRLQAYGLM